MNTVKKEQIDNLLKTHPEIADEFVKLDDTDAMAAMFSRYGVELSNEDLDDILKEADALPASAAGELGEDDLENVSGGFLTAALCLAAGYAGLVAGIQIRREHDRIKYGNPYRTYPKGYMGV